MDKILVCLDRDGTIHKDVGYIGGDEDWKEEIEILPGFVEGIRLLNSDKRIKIVVISNQAGVAKGFFDDKRVEEINNYINNLLKKQGVRIDNWQYCPYLSLDSARKKGVNSENNKWVLDNDDERVKLRKPDIGMVKQAAKELGFSLSAFDKIYVLGDKITDPEVGVNLNGLGILVYNGNNNKAKKEIGKRAKKDKKYKVINGFYEACEFIMKDIE